MAKDFTDKQRCFIKEYLVDKNATQAAIRSGYSEDTAGKIGSENLQKPDIASEIEAGLQKQMSKAEAKAASIGITKERWLKELELIAFADMDDFGTITTNGMSLVPTDVREKGLGRAIKKISETTSQHGGSQSLELHSKLAAMELMGKHLGWVKDKLEHSGEIRRTNEPASMTQEELEAESIRIDKQLGRNNT
jgi:phage terminase small subunit